MTYNPYCCAGWTQLFRLHFAVLVLLFKFFVFVAQTENTRQRASVQLYNDQTPNRPVEYHWKEQRRKKSPDKNTQKSKPRLLCFQSAYLRVLLHSQQNKEFNPVSDRRFRGLRSPRRTFIAKFIVLLSRISVFCINCWFFGYSSSRCPCILFFLKGTVLFLSQK